jgi:transposase-like protein
MNWETLYCPNRACRHYGQPFGQGLLVKNGTSHGKQQALCRACRRRVSLTYGTAYFDLEADPALFELAVRALAEGNSIYRTARIVQIDKDTVCAWLNRAARPCRLVRLYQQWWLSLAYYHLGLPHPSLREELPTPEPTRGNGSPRKWRPVTPAMAVGMTDHVWTTAELLGFRMPAPFLNTLEAIKHWFPVLDDAHHVN